MLWIHEKQAALRLISSLENITSLNLLILLETKKNNSNNQWKRCLQEKQSGFVILSVKKENLKPQEKPNSSTLFTCKNENVYQGKESKKHTTLSRYMWTWKRSNICWYLSINGALYFSSMDKWKHANCVSSILTWEMAFINYVLLQKVTFSTKGKIVLHIVSLWILLQVLSSS